MNFKEAKRKDDEIRTNNEKESLGTIVTLIFDF